MSFRPERGGPTTQEGIYFQNCVTVLKLAHMLTGESTEPPSWGRIVSVRPEAPEEVDDTVVTYESGRKEYIQSKTAVAPNSDAWRALWTHFYRQYKGDGFDRAEGGGRLTLAVRSTTRLDDLSKLLIAAETAPSHKEFLSRLTKGSRELLDSLETTLNADSEDLLKFLRHVVLWQLHFESDPSGADSFEKEVRRILYNTVEPLHAVFSMLLDLTAKSARKRAILAYADVKARLKQHGVRFTAETPRITSSSGEHARLLAEIEERKAAVSVFNERIKRLRLQWAIRTDTDHQFEDEQRISELSAKRAELTREIDGLLEKLEGQDGRP